MEKNMAFIAFIAAFLILIILISGCSKKGVEGPGLISDPPANLKFSSSDCSSELSESLRIGMMGKDAQANEIAYIQEYDGIRITPLKEGLQEPNWINGALFIQAFVQINCADSIGAGNYRMQDTKITLEYELIENPEGLSANCVCGHEINFTIANIERKNYQFELAAI